MTIKIICVFLLIFLSACTINRPRKIYLGQIDSHITYIYLCGLAKSFNAEEEKKHRAILNKIGEELNIRIIALNPRNKSKKFNNQICWPHANKQKTIKTYHSILKDLTGNQINGWIGFSNGGYFLQELSKFEKIDTPIITIGAAGTLDNKDNIFIMIGTKDEYALNRINELGYKFTKYNGAHEIEEQSLKNTIKKIIQTKAF